MIPRSPDQQVSTLFGVLGLGSDARGAFKRAARRRPDAHGRFKRAELGVLVAPQVVLTAAHMWRSETGRGDGETVTQDALDRMEMYALPAHLRIFGRPPASARAELVLGDRLFDIALLRLAAEYPVEAPLVVAPQVGALVTAFDRDGESHTQGRILAVETHRFAVDFVLSPGRSGSPLYDEAGALVGIHSARMEQHPRWPDRPIAIAARLDTWGPYVAACAQGAAA